MLNFPSLVHCQQEFYQQGDEERERKLKVSEFCDRNRDERAQMNLGFIDVLVLPLYQELDRIGSGNLKIPLLNLRATHTYWSQASVKKNGVNGTNGVKKNGVSGTNGVTNGVTLKISKAKQNGITQSVVSEIMVEDL